MIRNHLKPIRTRRISAMIVALLLCTGMLWLTDRCSHRTANPFGSGLPAKSGGDTLDVAIEISPLAYSMAGDTVSGLDYEMLRQMAAAHGRAVKFHPFAPLPYAVDGLVNGNFDILVASLPSTSRLKTELMLTDAVYLDRQVLVQRTIQADSAAYVASAEDLAGKEVWVGDGSPMADRLNNLADEIGDTIIVRSKPGRTPEHLIHLVAARKIDRAVVTQGLARTMCAADSTLTCSTPVSFTQFQTWAVSPKNPALLDTLNLWLRAYKTTPAYPALLSRHHLSR